MTTYIQVKYKEDNARTIVRFINSLPLELNFMHLKSRIDTDNSLYISPFILNKCNSVRKYSHQEQIEPITQRYILQYVN